MFWKTVLLAWLIFIGIDFFFHAALFSQHWKENIPAFKTPENLFLLIPAGYLSFLLLTILIGYLFEKIFKEIPTKSQSLSFALSFGLLFSCSNLLGLYSYIEIPLKHLILFNLVYLIETIAVTFIFHKSRTLEKLNKLTAILIGLFFLLILSGIIVQNVFGD